MVADARISKSLEAVGQLGKPSAGGVAALDTDTRKLMRGARLHQASYERDEARRRKRSSYFLKGPLPFLWIRENIPDPASRVILVARAFMDMENTNAYPLTRKVWDCAGVEGKDRRRRTLDKICRSTLGYTVITRPGRPSILRQASPASAP